MSRIALARARRSRSSEPIMRLLAFQLRGHWFCLPLMMVRRVLPKPMTPNYLDSDLIQLQNENITVLDAAKLVYGQTVASLPQTTDVMLPASIEEASPPLEKTVVVAELRSGESVGLVVDGIPTLKRVRQMSFSPVPPLYQTVHQLRGLVSIVRPDPNIPDTMNQLMFLLSLEALLQLDELSPLVDSSVGTR
jgi:chemotaxis signal transduction protein